MIQLVDYFIWVQNSNESIKKIVDDINQRKLPKLVYQDASINTCEFDEEKLKSKFNPNTYQIIRFKVGYVGGKSSNPLNKITFYNLKNGNIISENKVRSFSLLINQKYQEYFIRVYCTDLSLVDHYYDYFDNKKDGKSSDSDSNDLVFEPTPNMELVLDPIEQTEQNPNQIV